MKISIWWKSRLKKTRRDQGQALMNLINETKHAMRMIFYYKPGAALVFNENNPINYARPITVNVYFKAENPPPGYYESVRPKTKAYQTGHRHKFIPLCEPKHIEIVLDPGVYDLDYTLSSSLLHRYIFRSYCLGAYVRTSRWCQPRKSR